MMTTLLVRKETRDSLKALGRKGETYDAILQRLISGHRLGQHPAVHELPESGSEAKGYA